MITTNKIGNCTECKRVGITLAAIDGNDVALCVSCYDRAGDENAVSDGHMTCDQFVQRWGKHSEYCDCEMVPVVDPDADVFVVTLTRAELLRITSAILAPGRGLDNLDVEVLTALNTGIKQAV